MRQEQLSVFRIYITFCYYSPSPTPALYTLSLHDALPICALNNARLFFRDGEIVHADRRARLGGEVIAHIHELVRKNNRGLDRKSTRLNSSHVAISYAVFCLKKKNDHLYQQTVKQIVKTCK